MKLRGVGQDIDQVPTDTLVLSFFQDERPLKGQTGLCDWRLCGRLSKLIKTKYIEGQFGDPLLMPADRQLPCEKILVVGLGPRNLFSLDRFRQVVTNICEALRKLQVTRFALALPGIGLSELDPAEASDILGKLIPSAFGPDQRVLENVDVTVLADRGQLKSIAPVLARLERSFR
jgi:hypothetical protein